jgi:transcriptional regulator
LSTKTEQLEWRRSKIVELRARGLSQTEIARELQVSKASVSLDMQYLRNKAKECIKEYGIGILLGGSNDYCKLYCNELKVY